MRLRDHNPSPTLLLLALPASWTYRVWPSDSSCLVIQLLSPFRVVRTFICLSTLLRSCSPAVRGFPGRGKATQLQKGNPAPGPWVSFPALPICLSHSAAQTALKVLAGPARKEAAAYTAWDWDKREPGPHLSCCFQELRCSWCLLCKSLLS